MKSLIFSDAKPLFVYVVNVPMSNRDAKRFGLETVRAAGYEVEIWDIGPLSLPLYNRRDVDRHLEDHQRIFDSYKDFALSCKRLGLKDVLFCFPGMADHDRFSHRRLRAALSSSTCTVCTISSGHLPTGTAHAPFLARILRGAKDPRAAIRYLKHHVIHKALAELFGRVDWGVDYVFHGAKMTIDSRVIKNNTRLVSIHALDFDLLLDDKADSSPMDTSSNYFVYIDTLGPLHPDNLALGIEQFLDAKTWFGILRDCLLSVQQRSGLTPVVAGHPRGIGFKELVANSYQPYEVAFNKTVSLIRNSRLVLSEVSTSVWLAAWFKKPLALIRMPGLPSWYEREIVRLQEALDCEVWDAKANPSTWSRPTVNELKYEQYISRYVKLPGTPMNKFWDVVIETLAAEPHPKPAAEKSEAG